MHNISVTSFSFPFQEELLRLRFGQKTADHHETQTRDSELSLTMIVALALFTALIGIALGKFVL